MRVSAAFACACAYVLAAYGSAQVLDIGDLLQKKDTYRFVAGIHKVAAGGCKEVGDGAVDQEHGFQTVAGFCAKLNGAFPYDLPEESKMMKVAKSARQFCVPYVREDAEGRTEKRTTFLVQGFESEDCSGESAFEVYKDLEYKGYKETSAFEDSIVNNSVSVDISRVFRELVFQTCEDKNETSVLYTCTSIGDLATLLDSGSILTRNLQYPIMRISQLDGNILGSQQLCGKLSGNGIWKSVVGGDGTKRDLTVASQTFGTSLLGGDMLVPQKMCTTLDIDGETISFTGYCDIRATVPNRPQKVVAYKGTCLERNSPVKFNETFTHCLGINNIFGLGASFMAQCDFVITLTVPSGKPTMSPTEAPTFSPTPNASSPNTDHNNTDQHGPPTPSLPLDPTQSTEGVWVAVVPAVVIFAFVMYLCVTKRQRRGSSDSLEGDVESGVSTNTMRTFGANVAGFQVSFVKVKNGKSKSRFSDEEAGPESESSSTSSFAISPKEINIGKLIGKGAHGKVYEGTFQGSMVAVKEFTGSRSKKSFEREFRNLQSLKHPNIIRLYGTVTMEAKPHGTRRMLVMERAQSSIAAFLASKNSPQPPFQNGATIATILQWAQQICSGCSYIHSRNLIHFDIKPENILLDAALNVKICDMGISHTVKSAVREPSAANQEGGTPSYTAPELFTMERESITKAVDVYSFAILFWQLFHHSPPHPGSWNLLKLITEVTDGGYRPEIDPTVPSILANIMESCWAENSKDRPDFDELVKDFDILLGPRSVDVAAKMAGRPPFEKGQKVFVWDHSKMKFVSSEAALVQSNINRDGSYFVQYGSVSQNVPAADLLLCTSSF